MRIFIALGLATLLSACAHQQQGGLYKWGSYEQGLYSAYKDPNQVEALRLKLETHVNAMESSKGRVAPGLYAELGTLYYQSGNTEKAKLYYGKEREAWPESAGLMTALLQNIDRRQQGNKEEVK